MLYTFHYQGYHQSLYRTEANQISHAFEDAHQRDQPTPRRRTITHLALLLSSGYPPHLNKQLYLYRVGGGLRSHQLLHKRSNLREVCKPRAPCIVTWIIHQPISPQLHVYKLRSQTSQSSTHYTEQYTLHHTLSPALNCLHDQLLGSAS